MNSSTPTLSRKMASQDKSPLCGITIIRYCHNKPAMNNWTVQVWKLKEGKTVCTLSCMAWVCRDLWTNSTVRLKRLSLTLWSALGPFPLTGQPCSLNRRRHAQSYYNLICQGGVDIHGRSSLLWGEREWAQEKECWEGGTGRRGGRVSGCKLLINLL